MARATSPHTSSAPGDWIVGFQKRIGALLLVPLWSVGALCDGLQLALERNLQGILVETDSMTSVSLLNEKGLGSHELSNILNYCRFLLD